MFFRRGGAQLTVMIALVVAAVLLMCGVPHAAFAFEMPSGKPALHGQDASAGNMGRLYVFRPVRSFGAHIDDYVAINGLPVQRVRPGSGFYCDVSPGNYVINVLGHKSDHLKVSVKPGQRLYICVMLHHLGGVTPRGGALTSDQSFDVRLLEPAYGEQRVKEYRLTQGSCQRYTSWVAPFGASSSHKAGNL
jgi:hypothetical protein